MFKVVHKSSERHYLLNRTSDKLDTNYHYYSDNGVCFSNRGDGKLSPSEIDQIKSVVTKFDKSKLN